MLPEQPQGQGRRREEGLSGRHLCLRQASSGSPHTPPLTHPLGAASCEDHPGLGIDPPGSERPSWLGRHVQCIRRTVGVSQVAERPLSPCILSHSVHRSWPQTWPPPILLAGCACSPSQEVCSTDCTHSWPSRPHCGHSC